MTHMQCSFCLGSIPSSILQILDQGLNVHLVDKGRHDVTLEGQNGLPVVGHAKAGRHGNVSSEARHGIIVHVLVNTAIVLVVFQQRVSHGRVGALLLDDHPRINAVGVQPEERAGTVVSHVQDSRRTVAFQKLLEQLGHFNEMSNQTSEPVLAKHFEVRIRCQDTAATARGLQRILARMVFATLEQIRHLLFI